MTADSIVVVGAAGTQARAMLQYLSRAMDLSGLVAVVFTSMLPVSGAEQLNTSGARGERPMISHSWAYS